MAVGIKTRLDPRNHVIGVAILRLLISDSAPGFYVIKFIGRVLLRAVGHNSLDVPPSLPLGFGFF